jgi:DNA ligase-associated metallophosphoesterase
MTIPRTIAVCGQPLDLLPGKAAFWPSRKTLLIADPHWGKAAAFRAAGIAVSHDPLTRDLERLARLIAATAATRLVILGDLFHAKTGKSARVLREVSEWRTTHRGIEVLLIRGNHDRAAGDPPAAWGFECRTEPVLDPPFAFRHHPGDTPGHYTLAGHLHPAVTLRGPARGKLRIPCFQFGPSSAILPAFGGFTGTAAIAPTANDRIFAVADDEVIEVRPSVQAG